MDMPIAPQIDTVLATIEATLDQAKNRWFDLLRIPSVSAQPDHAGDCQAAAEWMRAQLTAIGFEAAVHATQGHPIVLATHPGPPLASGSHAPHLLYYGHYDVQPAEPLELWTAAPFHPKLTDGPNGPRVVARGAVDDKGQVMTWLEAMRAWHAATGSLPVRVTAVIEGEEEVGSASLEPFLVAHRAELAADIAVISDTNMWDIDTPALTTRLRGMVYAQLDIRAADKDLHSGLFGGVAANPINILTHILGGLHDAEGRIQIPGFYDGVADLPPEQLAEWAALGFEEAALLAGVGLHSPAGESGRAPLERQWARPTADINGIWGGYQGAGSKTVIPAEAGAKISFRLVPGQDPDAVAAAFRSFVESRLPPGIAADVQILSTAPGVEIPLGTTHIAAARQALAEEYGRPAIMMGCGGSIPVVESMHRPPRHRQHPARLWPGGRPGPFPQREVRVALLPPRHPRPCPPARPARPPRQVSLDRLRLARTEGVGPVTYKRLMARFGDAAAALEALPGLASGAGRIAPPAIPKPADMRREMEGVARLGGRMLFIGDPDYPPLLDLLEAGPPVLTMLGDPAVFRDRAIAVVGARNASANGRKMAELLAADLAMKGLVVVSGLARGIDAAAHEGALRTGRTIAAIAGGIDIPYPPENADLQARIAERGAVVAEAPLGTAPQARHFPRRNRVIAGLALGVVVIEAAPRSGSLITARMAQEASRELFAVPGSPLDPRCRGSNDLIRSEGAHLTESAADVIDNLPDHPRTLPAALPPGLAEPPASFGTAEGRRLRHPCPAPGTSQPRMGAG